MSRILFLGGTRFVGRAMAEAALSAGHTVTLFHRGQSGRDLFPEAEHVFGDRTLGLDALAGREWDWIVDVAGYAPSVVRKSVEYLKGRVGSYAFVSSISVHSGEGDLPLSESSPLHSSPGDWDGDETVTAETYGVLKALCEDEVRGGFGDLSLVVRPGLVVGPHDTSDRFTYWVRSAATQVALDIPTTPDQPVQFIDARDLGEFTTGLLRTGWHGTVNATGPANPTTFGTVWDSLIAALGRSVETSWESEGTAPLPCARDVGAFMEFDNRLALSLGLKPRPLAETVRDTWAWDQARGLPELSTEPSRFKRSNAAGP